MNRVEIYHNGKLHYYETFSSPQGARTFAKVYNHLNSVVVNGNIFRAIVQY